VRAPTAVWIDDRVAGGLPTEKDLELAERGLEQVQYVREDIVKRMITDAAGRAEQQPVQLTFGAGLLWALMNNGRIFMTDTSGFWEEYNPPPTTAEETNDGDDRTPP
jgi:hypothetical protein